MRSDNPMLRSLPPTAVILLGLLCACTGVIGDPGALPDAPVVRPGDDPSTCVLDVPPGALQRLTREQYDNTLRDLLGDDTAPARAFPADDDTNGFEVGITISPLHAEMYFSAAEAAAERAVARLDTLLPCERAITGDDACASMFVRDFVRRAFRRAPTAEELSRFDALYARGVEIDGFETGIELVITAALASPHLLYHVEPIPEDAAVGEVVPVTGYAMASRLSYFLWGSMPDDALLDAAESGALDTRAGVEAEARRMVLSPRARDGLAGFTRQWLRLDELDRIEKDPVLFPEFSRDLADDLRASIEAYVTYVVFEGDGTIEGLLENDFAFVNERLAAVYGIDGVSGDELVRMPVGASGRAGLLTQPGLLAILAKSNQSDPVHRGKFVRERLFCQNLPPPPDDIVVRAPDPAPGLSTRERFAEHSTNPACADCHRLMDPIGFGFEGYDALGQLRAEDDGRPVDVSGEILATDDANGPFVGVSELSERLAASRQVHECVSRQLLRYASRRVETRAEECALESVFDRAADGGWSIRELMVQLTLSDGFSYRRVEETSP